MNAATDDALSRYLASSDPYYIKAPSSHFDCAICTETIRDPVVCTSVHRTFCRNCLNSWIESKSQPTCPIDREPLKMPVKNAPVLVSDLLEDMAVMCPLGCGWQGKEGDRRTHMRENCEVAEKERQAYRDALGNYNADMKTSCKICQAAVWGTLYMCLRCRDYSVCAVCWDAGSQAAHSNTHAFVCVKSPDDIHRQAVAGVPAPNAVHPNTTCDACGLGPIAGPRFACQQPGCGIDLCEGCLLRGDEEVRIQRTNAVHDPSHPFRRIVRPAGPGPPPQRQAQTQAQAQAQAQMIQAQIQAQAQAHAQAGLHQPGHGHPQNALLQQHMQHVQLAQAQHAQAQHFSSFGAMGPPPHQHQHQQPTHHAPFLQQMGIQVPHHLNPHIPQPQPPQLFASSPVQGTVNFRFVQHQGPGMGIPATVTVTGPGSGPATMASTPQFAPPAPPPNTYTNPNPTPQANPNGRTCSTCNISLERRPHRACQQCPTLICRSCFLVHGGAFHDPRHRLIAVPASM